MEYAIGIRPVIDGRQGGIREGLEEQTMQMARTAKKLIEDNVRRSDGQPVKVVIADTTIGGGKESAMCEDKFSALNVVATLTVTPCWCYGTETMDLNPHTLKAVWGFNGTERPGAVYLAAVMAAYAQRGLPAFAIYGRDVQDMDDTTVPEDVQDKILRFARCAAAVGELKNKSYLNIGGVSMGIAGSNADAMMLQRYFGLRTEWIDMTEVLRRIKLGIYDKEQYDIARAWVKANCPIGLDINAVPHTAEQYEQDWDFIVKMTLICLDLMHGNPKLLEMGYKEESNGRNAIAAGFQGQRQWTDWLPNGDFTEAILNSTFDWNGKKEPTVFATENDCLNGMAMLVGNLLTHRAVGFADVRTYWSPEAVKRVTGKAPAGKAKDGFIHLINSGAAALDATGQAKGKDGKGEMKQWWDMTDKDISACLAATDWCPANLGYFRGGGFSSHFKTDAEMPVTMIRINIVNGLGPVIQLAEGYTVTLPDDMHRILDERTDKTWPTTWFAPNITGKGAFTDVYSVMANWGANHGAFVYGHIGKDVLTLASMLRIPVNMHNVADGDVYRPHCWTAFGTDDLQGADYRACSNYGPLFK
ncbi:MAG: L-fucose isomerase [Clostridia bacterium]|nr:L-fucose isomerase [Clostridia bacterium]